MRLIMNGDGEGSDCRRIEYIMGLDILRMLMWGLRSEHMRERFSLSTVGGARVEFIIIGSRWNRNPTFAQTQQTPSPIGLEDVFRGRLIIEQKAAYIFFVQQ